MVLFSLIEPGNVRYKDAQRALSQLERSGCQILGAVMNKIDTKADKYYSFYYKHYGGILPSGGRRE